MKQLVMQAAFLSATALVIPPVEATTPYPPATGQDQPVEHAYVPDVDDNNEDFSDEDEDVIIMEEDVDEDDQDFDDDEDDNNN